MWSTRRTAPKAERTSSRKFWTAAPLSRTGTNSTPRGADGKSLSYYQRTTKQWKQVWVTAMGPIEEKKLVEELKDGGVRFQGEIPKPDGMSHVDRTTLTPLKDDRVRQVIEISRDGGKTWQVTFDAEYQRPK